MHEEWTGRNLYFWFFAFETLYSQRDILHTLDGVAKHLEITSYASYELVGAYDLMLRLYLKPSVERKFRAAVKSELHSFGLLTEQPFRVAEVARHWAWASGPLGSGPIHMPLKEDLQRRHPRSELELLNDSHNTSPEREALIEKYTGLRFVTRTRRDMGIKFVVTIRSGEDPKPQVLKRVQNRLSKALDEAGDLLRERSLYVGEPGQQVLFMVMCRVSHQKFHAIRSGLFEIIGDAVSVVDARTTTFPIVSDDFLCFSDRLAIAAPPKPDLELLLHGEETQQFEVKGSLLAPVDPWLRDGKRLVEADQYPDKGVLKAVAGLLNSGGGTVLVGAVETRRYRDVEAAERLEGMPRIGPYTCLGIVDPTFTQQGWDKWERRLRDLIRGRIDPDPGVLVRPEQVELHGKTLCVIHVDEPGEDDAFWLKTGPNASTFFARQGSEVVPLQALDIDQHRRRMRQSRRGRRSAA